MADKKTVTRPVVDAHVHLFPTRVAARASDNIVRFYGIPREGDGSAEGLLEACASFADVRFVICAAALGLSDPSAGNDHLLDLAREDKRFLPLCSVHPAMEAKAAVAELDRCFQRGARGVKLHPDFQRYYADDERAVALCRYIASCGKPLLLHVGDPKADFSHPRRVRNLIEQVPDLTVVAAHLCGYRAWEDAKTYLIGAPVYTDTSEALYWLPQEEVLELIRRHGTDRVLFGSDFPLWSPRHSFDELDALPLTEEEKQAIFHDNALRVYGAEEG